jgi:hypothetical protein
MKTSNHAVVAQASRRCVDDGAGENLTRHLQRRICNDPFPLAPALSPEEREKRSQRLGKVAATFLQRKAAAGCYSADKRISENAQRLFPLPGGEGQGEGKAHNLATARVKQNFIFQIFFGTYRRDACATTQ